MERCPDSKNQKKCRYDTRLPTSFLCQTSVRRYSYDCFFFAMLGNANEWKEIESFARKKEAWLRKYLELPFGIPTDDTYRIVMGMIAIESFFVQQYNF